MSNVSNDLLDHVRGGLFGAPVPATARAPQGFWVGRPKLLDANGKMPTVNGKTFDGNGKIPWLNK
jgi:hypothetical protein